MKMSNYTELSGHSFDNVYIENDPPDPPDPKSTICPEFPHFPRKAIMSELRKRHMNNHGNNTQLRTIRNASKGIPSSC